MHRNRYRLISEIRSWTISGHHMWVEKSNLDVTQINMACEVCVCVQVETAESTLTE